MHGAWVPCDRVPPSRISHRMVFVVNELTWFEQKYVAMLHQKYVQCKQHKALGCHVIDIC